MPGKGDPVRGAGGGTEGSLPCGRVGGGESVGAEEAEDAGPVEGLGVAADSGYFDAGVDAEEGEIGGEGVLDLEGFFFVHSGVGRGSTGAVDVKGEEGFSGLGEVEEGGYAGGDVGGFDAAAHELDLHAGDEVVFEHDQTLAVFVDADAHAVGVVLLAVRAEGVAAVEPEGDEEGVVFP